MNKTAIPALNPPKQKERDPIVEAVRAKLLQRSERGLTKYGVTVAKADLTHRDWLRHAQEEALDLAVYLEKLILSEHVTERYDSLGLPKAEYVPSDYGDCNNCGLTLAEHEQSKWCPSPPSSSQAENKD